MCHEKVVDVVSGKPFRLKKQFLNSNSKKLHFRLITSNVTDILLDLYEKKNEKKKKHFNQELEKHRNVAFSQWLNLIKFASPCE